MVYLVFLSKQKWTLVLTFYWIYNLFLFFLIEWFRHNLRNWNSTWKICWIRVSSDQVYPHEVIQCCLFEKRTVLVVCVLTTIIWIRSPLRISLLFQWYMISLTNFKGQVTPLRLIFSRVITNWGWNKMTFWRWLFELDVVIMSSW